MQNKLRGCVFLQKKQAGSEHDPVPGPRHGTRTRNTGPEPARTEPGVGHQSSDWLTSIKLNDPGEHACAQAVAQTVMLPLFPTNLQSSA